MKLQTKKILLIAVWTLLIAGVGVLIFMINAHRQNQICEKINIQIEGTENNHFIDSDLVLDYIQSTQIIGNRIENIDASKIESLLENNPHIKKAEVYKAVDGAVFIKVWQRKAVMRVFNLDNESYYVDEENMKMPLSENFTARVAVCNGNISEKCTKCDTINSNILKTCAGIAQYVHKTPFWFSSIEQIFVTSDSVIVLTTKLGDMKVVFGDANDIEGKFERLLAFYKQALPKAGWEKYSSIDVSFANQIVAKKKMANIE